MFLDPSRINLPDIDIDFQEDRRYEVIEYVINKYGRDSVCQIITFGTMAARGAVRAVCRALDFPYAVGDLVSKMIPKEPGITLRAALEISPDLKAKYNYDENVKRLIDIAIQLEGLPLYTGTHAAGVLITDVKGVNAYVPTWNGDKGIVSQFSMDILDELGLLKMDFLALKTLTVIDKTMQHIKQNYGVDIDLDELYKCEDLKPLELIKEGFTEGIFQLEQSGMTAFFKELKPRNIEEIIAGISLYRPGPLQYIPKFLENRRNKESITYIFKELEPILSETYGILIYQGVTCLQI